MPSGILKAQKNVFLRSISMIKNYLEQHLNWGKSPNAFRHQGGRSDYYSSDCNCGSCDSESGYTPFISTYDNLPHAKNFANRMRQLGKEGVMIMVIEPDLLPLGKQKTMIAATEAVRDLGIFVPPKVQKSLRGEVLLLNKVPSDAIVSIITRW